MTALSILIQAIAKRTAENVMRSGTRTEEFAFLVDRRIARLVWVHGDYVHLKIGNEELVLSFSEALTLTGALMAFTAKVDNTDNITLT